MTDAATKVEPRYTWDDYRRWPDDERWEIVEGVPYGMSPSPSARHQMTLSELARQMANHFHGHKCRLIPAPMDVRLSEEDVVQPDIPVVCDPKQIKPTHIEGAPALVVEILSPETEEHDRIRKSRLYARAGAKEYWIVTPHPSSVEVLVLDGPTYRLHGVYGKQERTASATFPELKIRLADVFDFPLEPHERPPAIKEPPGRAYRAKRRK